MSQTTQTAAKKILDRGVGLVISTSGGGAQAISDLLRIPGASRSILSAFVPYSRASQEELVAQPIEKACSARTAQLLSQATYRKARQYSDDHSQVLGLGCTAALRTNREKKGEHRAHLASWDGEVLRTWSLVFNKLARTRDEEEDLVRFLILDLLASACGVPDSDLSSPFVGAGESLTKTQENLTDPILLLHRGEIAHVTLSPSGQLSDNAPPEGILFPGSFHPLHTGHREMASLMSASGRGPVIHEISIQRVDKDPLSLSEIHRRVAQFASPGSPGEWVVLTTTPTFLEKARLFPRRAFLVGCDTAERVLDPSYHGGSLARRNQALEEILSLGGSFIVMGRTDGERFQTVHDLDLPLQYSGMFIGVGREIFQNDISSSEIRGTWEQA